MKNTNTCYYVGFANDKNDIASPQCKTIQAALALIEHYQINELNDNFTCNVYAVRNAQKKKYSYSLLIKEGRTHNEHK